MIKSNLSIIFPVLALIFIGLIFWLFSNPAGPKLPSLTTISEIDSLLDNLEQETAIDFSQIPLADFAWQSKYQEAKIDLKGRGRKAAKISGEDLKKISAFFLENGFKIEPQNEAGKTTGYQKNQMVCLVVTEAAGSTDNSFSVEVKCSRL